MSTRDETPPRAVSGVDDSVRSALVRPQDREMWEGFAQDLGILYSSRLRHGARRMAPGSLNERDRE